MQQFWSIKKDHMDKILFFRMGDFFEMFGEDAEVAAPILNIALTQRNKKSGDDTKMCGMPHHSIAVPISKLLASGRKIAICDQVEDPKQAKGIVKRAVTRILSPGMVYDPETLDQLSANYLCAFDSETISFLETSTGEAFFYRLSQAADQMRVLSLLCPVEIVLDSKQKNFWDEKYQFHISVFDGKKETQALPVSAARLLGYAEMMQGKEVLKTLTDFEERRLTSRMELSQTVIRHLELFETYKGEKHGSFFSGINRTKTSGGARKLKDWIRFPLTDIKEINSRLDQVQSWFDKPGDLKRLRPILARMGDIERRIGKISNPGCNARDLVALSTSLRSGLEASQIEGLQQISPHLIELAMGVVQSIESTIEEGPCLSVREGHIIQRGVNSTLDEYIEVSKNVNQLLVDLEAKEKRSTGISSLKIRYNNVFGYYIEVTKTHTSKVPKHYVRKQTLTNAERYITDELQKIEDQVLAAKTKRSDLEFEIFENLRVSVMQKSPDLISLSRSWSELDVVSSFAWLALEYNLHRPAVSEDRSLVLENSRHLVVEQEVSRPFVPNSIQLKDGGCLLLTGPNMAGKSTLMRQVALSTIMAQMGSYVPATKAQLPIFDRIFTRIGASDHLSEGLSTFMVEMKETAEMLSQASENSLVILDEVGRGTSTYDGMSLAQSILEYLLSQKRCMTFFATHYHELTGLERSFSQIINSHMSISEKKGQISFLYTLAQGPANKSYGIQVAQLAGLPAQVTSRAKKLLNGFEALNGAPSDQMSFLDLPSSHEDVEVEKDQALEKLIEKIQGVSLQKTTPLDALNMIAEWQIELS